MVCLTVELIDVHSVVDKLGFDYRMADGHIWQDYCPRCKRVMRGLAYASFRKAKDVEPQINADRRG
jgi:hypothetical protein